MNIQEIKQSVASKAGINVVTLDFSRQKDEKTGLPTEWLSHWDNDSRVRVVAHEEIIAKLKADKAFAGLALKPMETIPATDTRAEYRQFVLITPTSIEASF